MSFTVDAVIERYMQLRAEKEALAAKQSEEMKPIYDAMEKIETWLMAQANAQGVESFKTAHGTAFKTTSTSVTMADKDVFISYLLRPLADQVLSLLSRIPDYKPQSEAEVVNTIKDAIRWDLTDLRAGKKGIQETLELGQEPPPGVNITRTQTIQVRKS